MRRLQETLMEIVESNSYIAALIQEGKPFLIARLGLGIETEMTVEYYLTKKVNPRYLKPSMNLNGIYSKQNDLRVIESFCKKYNECLKNSNALACFPTNTVQTYQRHFLERYALQAIHSAALEPLYVCQRNIRPWTHSLLGKKVLIIHPFVESFQKQVQNKFQLFPNNPIFLEGQEFLFYKSFQTIAGNHIHDNWFETFTIMCNDIRKLDFDIALLGCGGYGLPLCNFIKTNMNKSAIYIGGVLQMLFGVLGTRWETAEEWKTIIEENKQLIRPSSEETCPNYKKIEGGCYW